MNLDDRQIQVALSALRVAVQEYYDSAKIMRADKQDGLAGQFERQATEAQDLIDTLEACGY